MMKRDFDLGQGDYGRMKVTRMLGIGRVLDNVGDEGKMKYFSVMKSVTTNRDEGNETIRGLRNQ